MAKQKTDESDLTNAIIDIFKSSCDNYGTRKIKRELAKIDRTVSRLCIGRIMKQEGLVLELCGIGLERDVCLPVAYPLEKYVFLGDVCSTLFSSIALTSRVQNVIL